MRTTYSQVRIELRHLINFQTKSKSKVNKIDRSSSGKRKREIGTSVGGHISVTLCECGKG